MIRREAPEKNEYFRSYFKTNPCLYPLEIDDSNAVFTLKTLFLAPAAHLPSYFPLFFLKTLQNLIPYKFCSKITYTPKIGTPPPGGGVRHKPQNHRKTKRYKPYGRGQILRVYHKIDSKSALSEQKNEKHPKTVINGSKLDSHSEPDSYTHLTLKTTPNV